MRGASLIVILFSVPVLVFNIGTASQLAVVIPDDVCNKKLALPHHSAATDIQNNALQILPFFQGTKVITAASLSGNVIHQVN